MSETLRNVDVSQREMSRGWLGRGRDHAEDDPSWESFRRSDHRNYDAWTDELATGDPFDIEYHAPMGYGLSKRRGHIPAADDPAPRRA